MDYTQEQYDAIHTHDCNLIVTAGAGSGKTRVLVDRFVAVLDAHPDWTLPSLVAITFTEKAAREMRDRVRQSIEQKITAATEAYDDPAVTRWRTHEAALARARIGTIHGLCATILRANAAEIGIDPGFAVSDEVNAAILLGGALDQVFAALAEEGHAAAQLISEYGLSRVRRELIHLVGLPEESWPKPVAYLEQWRARYEANARQVLEALRNDAEFVGAVTWDAAANCTDPTDKLMQSWSRVIETRDSLSPDNPQQTLDVLTRWRDDIKLTGGKNSAWGGKEQVTFAKDQLRLIRERAEEALEWIGTWGDADEKAAALLPLWGEAVTCVKQVYQAAKMDQRVLDFNDLEMLTRQLLQNEAVAARYRDREFHHLLVDEFQDTNRAQRDIIYALSGLDRPGSLFVVGDPRQSIYKFRGADVSVFDQVRQDILQSGGREITLGMSFRTHTQLADELNTIFSQLLTRTDGPTAAYEVEMGQPMTAFRATESNDSPCMEIILIDKKNATGEDRADDMRRWEAWALAQRLRQMIDETLPVWDKQRRLYRPIQYGDVAVLFQATRSMPLVEEVFKAAEIPYVTVAGKGYFNRPEIEDLRSLLDALYNPFDDLALAAALRSPLYGLSDDTLLALRLQRDEADARLSLWSALTEREIYDPVVPDMTQVLFAHQSLQRLHDMAGRVTIAELLERALEETAYRATLTGLTDGARRCENVEKLIEVARRSQRFTLGDFTAYLQDLSEREAREGEALIEAEGSVHLMTVHASKGLEFPVVSLFDASFDHKADDAPLIIDPDIGPACSVIDGDGSTVKPFAYQMARRYDAARDHAERTRLLYVGMTRAQDYVIISGQNNNKGQWLKQLREALDLPQEPEEEENIIAHDYRLYIPKDQPNEDQYAAKSSPHLTGWDHLNDRPAPDFGAVEAWSPPLVAAPPVDPHAPARVLQATDIALLGKAKAEGNPGMFRHSVLRDAPDLIHTVAGGKTGVTRRIIGEMVHQALRWWRLPGNTPDLRRVLDSYAWEQGLTDPQMIEDAISRAADLLQRTEDSLLFRQMNESSQVYRELPFTFKLGQRTINGVIDVLFFSKYQRWVVADYKTSFVGPEYGARFPERIAVHAARYHAQIGIYAAAVESLTGQTPDTYLHYVRYVHTLRIEPDTWRTVLQSLDTDITDTLAGSE